MQVNVPLGFIGVVGMLYLTGTALSIQSFMGLIMMVGIVVEYRILLVDFANRRLAEGLTPAQAVLDYNQAQFRLLFATGEIAKKEFSASLKSSKPEN